MTCLVDANVLCEATKPSPDLRVIEWLRRNESDLAIDPVILGKCASVSFCFHLDDGAEISNAGSTRSPGAFTVYHGTPRRGCAGPNCWRISVLSENRCRSRTVSLPQPPLPMNYSLRPGIGEISKPVA